MQHHGRSDWQRQPDRTYARPSILGRSQSTVLKAASLWTTILIASNASGYAKARRLPTRIGPSPTGAARTTLVPNGIGGVLYRLSSISAEALDVSQFSGSPPSGTTSGSPEPLGVLGSVAGWSSGLRSC